MLRDAPFQATSRRHYGLPGLRVVGVLAVLIAPVGRTLEAQGPIPADVRLRIIAALQPDFGQRVDIVADSSPSTLPGVTVFRGRRLPPPYPTPEDARPRFASVVVCDSGSELVDRLSHAPRAWELASPRPIASPRQALAATLALLRMTGLVSGGQLLASPSEARRKVARSALRNPHAIDLVRAPRAATVPDGVLVEFFAAMPLGLYKYSVTIDRANRFGVEVVMLSPLVLQM